MALRARLDWGTMRFINKYRVPIVWLLIIALVASIGAGFFAQIF